MRKSSTGSGRPAPGGRERPGILFVSHTAEWIGATNSLFNTLPYLRQWYDVEVLMLGRGAFADALAEIGIPFECVDSLPKEAIPGLRRRIRRRGYGLVYANAVNGAARNAMLAARLARVPFACHSRSMAVGPGALRKYAFLNLADAVVAISEACAASLRWKVLRTKKVHVVYNGTEVSRFEVDRAEARRRIRAELRVPEEDALAVYVGHLKARKGQEHAVAALRECVDRGAGVTLALVGRLDREPEYAARVRERVERHGLGDRVRFTGFREDVPEILAGSDLYVHACVEEAFGRAVIEAMAAGLPVAAFAADGVAEIVRDGETGFLSPVGEVAGLSAAIERLVRDPALRRRMAEAGRRRVRETFTARAAAERLRDVIGRLVGGPAGEAGEAGGPAARAAERPTRAGGRGPTDGWTRSSELRRRERHEEARVR